MRPAIIILLILGLLIPAVGNAAIPGLGGAFGGRILGVQYCTCSFNLLLYIGPPRGGTFIYSPGISTLYQYYQVFRGGPWALGTSAGTGTCLQYAVIGCVTTGFGSIIRKIGTSLY
jgi:hypothetical protein